MPAVDEHNLALRAPEVHRKAVLHIEEIGSEALLRRVLSALVAAHGIRFPVRLEDLEARLDLPGLDLERLDGGGEPEALAFRFQDLSGLCLLRAARDAREPDLLQQGERPLFVIVFHCSHPFRSKRTLRRVKALRGKLRRFQSGPLPARSFRAGRAYHFVLQCMLFVWEDQKFGRTFEKSTVLTNRISSTFMPDCAK